MHPVPRHQHTTMFLQVKRAQASRTKPPSAVTSAGGSHLVPSRAEMFCPATASRPQLLRRVNIDQVAVGSFASVTMLLWSSRACDIFLFSFLGLWRGMVIRAGIAGLRTRQGGATRMRASSY